MIDVQYRFREIQTRQDGVVLVFFAIVLPLLIGITALALDISYNLAKRNDAQRAADNAALSVSRAAQGASDAGKIGEIPLAFAMAEAARIAKINGYENGVNGVDVQVHTAFPEGTTPLRDAFLYTDSNYKYVPGAVEVTIKLPQQRFFGTLFSATRQNMQARAVGIGQSVCVLVLNKHLQNTLAVSGGIETGCGFVVNSDFNSGVSAGSTPTSNFDVENSVNSAENGDYGAATLSGSGTVTVSSLTVTGNGDVFDTNGSGSDVCSSSKLTPCPYFRQASPLPNPYANLNTKYSKPNISNYLAMSAPSSSEFPILFNFLTYVSTNANSLCPNLSGTPVQICATSAANCNGQLKYKTSVGSNAPPSCPSSCASMLSSGTLTLSGVNSTTSASNMDLVIDSNTTLSSGSMYSVNNTLIENNALLKVSNSGKFNLLNIANPVSDGRIEIDNGGIMCVTPDININNNWTISNGNLRAANEIEIGSNTANANVTFDLNSNIYSNSLKVRSGSRLNINNSNVVVSDLTTINGDLKVENGSTLFLKNGINITGTVTIETGAKIIVDKQGAGTIGAEVSGTLNIGSAAGGGELIIRSGGASVSGTININEGNNTNPTKFILLTRTLSGYSSNPGSLSVSGTFNVNSLKSWPQTSTSDVFLIEGQDGDITEACALDRSDCATETVCPSNIDSTSIPNLPHVCPVDNQGTIKLGPGLYYIEGGINTRAAVLTGQIITSGPDTGKPIAGTTIALGPYGAFNTIGNSVIKLSAPNGGEWNDVAIYQQDPDTDAFSPPAYPYNPEEAMTTKSLLQSNSGSFYVDGSVVLPRSNVVYKASATDPNICTFFVVNRLNIDAASATLASNCTTYSSITNAGRGRLAE